MGIPVVKHFLRGCGQLRELARGYLAQSLLSFGLKIYFGYSTAKLIS
jgi:hypothetical protein